MRIIVNGQQAFGKNVLDRLLERGENVVGVYSAPEKPGQRPDPLTESAREHGLALFQPRSFKKPEVLEEFLALEPDLCVMAYVTLLVPEPLLYAPTHGTIQYHPSLLPRHRGPSSINWPIIQGETETGLSIFWPDEGLDTGPLLIQKKVSIGPDDTLGSIYFNHLLPMGVDALLEGVDLVKAGGDLPHIVQDESEATYEGWCARDHAHIDWNRSAADVHNLIRGTNPQPGAWTTLGAQTVQIFDCLRAGDDTDGAPGTILAADENGLEVATGAGAIQIQRVRPEGAKKLPVGEWLSSGGPAAGDRFV